MTGIIDGKAVAADVARKVTEQTAALKAATGVTPGLAVVIVGWLVAQTLAVILLSLEEQQGSQEPEEQGHARPPGIVGKRAQQ